MSLDQTKLCNLALGRVGAAPIMSINDADSKGARVCLLNFEAAVREAARAGEWNCLKKRDTLGQLSAAPAFEWAYQYQLPADLISLVELNGVAYHGEPQDDWEIEGRVLLTDADIAQVRYIAYVEDCTQWDALFTNAVVVLLAAKIAVPMRQDEGMATALLTEYQRVALPQARQKDGNERRKRRHDPCEGSRFLASRYYSTNG
jgi:hypothetical protein